MTEIAGIKVCVSGDDLDDVTENVMCIPFGRLVQGVSLVTLDDQCGLKSADGEEKESCELVLMCAVQGMLIIQSIPSTSDIHEMSAIVPLSSTME